ncbi:hypothetical protein HMPREF1586_00649, partial [Gardnerella vaginalis JCP8522]
NLLAHSRNRIVIKSLRFERAYSLRSNPRKLQATTFIQSAL